jgi:hypothetical protein
MTTFDENQHPRSAAGKFDTKAQTPPEAKVLLSGIQTVDDFLSGQARPMAEDKDYVPSTILIDDLTSRVSEGVVFEFTGETELNADKIVPGATQVGISKNNFGPLTWVQHADLDVSGMILAGAEGIANREGVGNWLDDNSAAVHEFFVDKDISVSGGAWDEMRPTISAYFLEGQPVTAEAAGTLLESTPGLTYLRANADPATSTIPTDLMAFVAVYEASDDDEDEKCDECDGSLDDNEGYDGLCGSCADKAEEEGRWS